ncbi:MAG: tetratricopeptide repeat protein [Prevotellaceae bacterium]|jgi:tetratricopeptide (TPR) repeat protein|nr:tetratricopeptide repeat protein [Prevotellaceae bacterium]
MKKIIIAALALFLSASAFANNQKGIDFYNAGQLQPAKAFFDNAAQNAETFYYLGRIAFDQGRIDEAAACFQKGVQADPANLLNKIGEGMVLLKQNNLKAAADIFKAATGVNKRDADVYIAVAYAYLNNGMITEARENLELSRRYNYQNPRLFLLEGDIYAAENNIGAAASAFNQALQLDPKLKEAYLKYARVYYTINPDLAVERLQQLLQIDPNCIIAYREMGEIFFYNRQFTKASEAYSNFFAEGAGIYSIDDIARYAFILFSGKEFDRSLEMVKKGLQQDANHFLLNRLNMYNEYELKNYDAASQAANTFFALNSENNKFVALDYIFYGRLLLAQGNTEAALASFKKAIEIDPSNAEINKEIAELYSDAKDFDNGLAYYAKFIEASGDKLVNTDYFAYGQYIYKAASNIVNNNPAPLTPELTAKKDSLLNLADAQFAIVQERAPNSHLGAFWRGHTKALMDMTSELGLAKEHYETVVAILTNPELELTAARQRDLITAYHYLANYFYSQKMFEDSKIFWNKILELDPAYQPALDAQRLPGIK